MTPPLDARLRTAQELILRIAAGDYGARADYSAARDELDATIAAVHMLAEELDAAHGARRRAEDLLRDEREAYDNAPANFCSVAAHDYRILRCNRTLSRTVGAPRKALLGRSLLELLSPGSQDLAALALERVREGSEPGGVELALEREDGEAVPVLLSGSVVLGQDGEPDRLRLVLRDIGEHKRLQAQLRQSQKMEAVGQLAGGVAHDFNNLLTLISNYATFVQEAIPADSPALADLAELRNATDRAAELTAHLLAFSRRQVLRAEPVALNPFVAELQRMLARVLGVRIEIALDLDPAVQGVSVDPTLFHQVLLNVAINARDAMPSGGTITITTSRLRIGKRISGQEGPHPDVPAGEYVGLTVADQGKGMSAEVRARAFEPFFSTKGKARGTGLGLSMCYGIVRQLDGDIILQSERGRGTRVHIFLPAIAAPRPVASASAGADTAAPRELAAPTEAGPVEILVVEDQPQLRSLVRRTLVRAGYRVREAEHGVDALELIDREPPQLVVTDVMMPQMDGVALAARLRDSHPGVPVLFMSGFPETASGADVELPAGAPLLAKPFGTTELLRAVRDALSEQAERALSDPTNGAPAVAPTPDRQA